MTDNFASEDCGREGRYANHFNIGHNAFEFVLQFGQFYEGDSQAVIHTRIVTSPAYAALFLQLLGNAIAEYENRFGRKTAGDLDE
jgi:hypothetical protein